MRAAWLLTILLASAAWGLIPGGSAQNPVGDACAGVQDGEHCTAAETITNGLAWICRHAGGPEEQCSQLDGRTITSAAVDAYLATDSHHILELLRQAEDNTPLIDTHWMHTHNSYNSAWYEPTLSGMDPNQQYSITDQLRMGIRALELDLHWFPDPGSEGFAPVVCHARPASQMHFGCSTERHLATVLAEIRVWMDANPRDVLMLNLEDHLQHTAETDAEAPYDEASRILQAAFGDRILRPSDHDAECIHGQPLQLSRNDIMDLGARVILQSDCGQGGSWPALIHSFDVAWSQQGMPVDGCQFDADAFAKTWTRTWEDGTLVGDLAGDVAAVTADNIPDLMACGFNQIGLDHLRPDDGRLEAFRQSWIPTIVLPPPPPTTVKGLEDGEVVELPDADDDGVPDRDDLCPDWPDAIDSDLDGTPDGCDESPEGAGSRGAPLPFAWPVMALAIALLRRH